jgi:hypothetical protein
MLGYITPRVRRIDNKMPQKESQIEQNLIHKLEELKYTYRPDIRDKATLEQNFRERFEALNRVRLTDAEFARLRDEIIAIVPTLQRGNAAPGAPASSIDGN